jgi:hypothetical protein
VLNVLLDSPIRRMKKYASSARIAAASAVSPHFRTRSGRRDAGDRSRVERPPVTVVALASTTNLYEIGDPLQTIVASCVLSLSASDEGTGAYGS